MNNAAPPLMQIPLSSFLGLYTEAQPNDLPEGVSPMTWDTDFIIGSVKMRPGLQSALTFTGQNTGPSGCTIGTNHSLSQAPWQSPGLITTLDGQYASVTPIGQTIGPNLSGAGSQVGLGTAWTNPNNVTSGTAFATVTLAPNAVSKQLKAQTFSFVVPSNYVATGIGISFKASSNAIHGGISVQLLRNNVPVGSSRLAFPTSAASTITINLNDLWGAAFLNTDLSSANWGVQFTVTGATNGGTWSVGNVQATLYSNTTSSDALYAQQFGFTLAALPINGIVFGITGHQTDSGTVTVQLLKNGLPVGNSVPTTLTLADSRILVGASNFLWGATSLTAADLNNGAFGISVVATGGGTVFIDFVDCTVYQTSGSQNFNWVKTYAQRSQQVSTLALDNIGTLWSENVTGNQGVLTSINTTIQPNCFGRSVTLDDVEYLALSDLQQGRDMPRQWNGVNLDRIAQVGPGAAPSFGFTSNGVSLLAAPNGVTQAAAFLPPDITAPSHQTYLLWSTSPSSSTPGNILTFVFPGNYTPPQPLVNGAYIVIAGLQSMNGFNANSGAGTNPTAYQIFNVGGPIAGNSYYSAFSVLLSQSGYYSGRIQVGTSLQLSLATATASAQVPDIQVGSQFVLAGVTAAGWNGTWTCQQTPNAGQYTVTNSSLAANVATISYTLITGANPTVGQTVQITGCVNGNGIFNGSFVVQTVGGGAFTVNINSGTVASAAENGQAIVNGTIFKFEPQKVVSNSGGGTISTSGAIGAGSRAAVCMFLTRNGFLSPPSPYVQFSTTGGATSLTASNIPIGPPNVIARVIAFTGAQVTQVPGQIGNFFWIPAPVTVFDANAGQNVTYTPTIIKDNTTTRATFTFTDAVLLAATGIDVQGNNLFEQKELGPVLGIMAYGQRLMAWGELNKVTNFNNISFDGGYGINSTLGALTPGSSTYPLGWTPADTLGSVRTDAEFGDSYYIFQTGAATVIGQITQSACQDQYGVNILNPQVTYSVRIAARAPSGITNGSVVVDLYSPSFNRVYGTANFPLNAMSTAFQLFSSTLLTTPFTVAVVPDLQIRVYGLNMVINSDVELDRIEPYPTTQPILSTQAAVSYINNFEAFDQVTGVVDTAIVNQQPVRAGFTQGDTAYLVKSGSFVSVQDNGVTEPSGWTIRTISNSVGTPSVNGVDYVDSQNQGESYALIAGRSGVYIFNGGDPVVCSGEIRSLWNKIPWQYGHTLWIRNDQVNRRILVGVPLATPNQWLPNATVNANPTTPNVVLAMSYKEVNHISELMDGKTVRTSFTGKLIAPEISRKWSIWQITAPYADFVTRQDNTAPLFLGNSKGTGKIYQLTEGRSDDDGAAINELYTTYAFIGADLDQALQLGLARKQFSYLTLNVNGTGSLGIKVLPDDLASPYAHSLIPITLPIPGFADAEVPLNESASRLFLQFSTNAVGSNFQISRAVVALMKDTFTPVRGR